jgi:hypothetical protein
LTRSFSHGSHILFGTLVWTSLSTTAATSTVRYFFLPPDGTLSQLVTDFRSPRHSQPGSRNRASRVTTPSPIGTSGARVLPMESRPTTGSREAFLLGAKPEHGLTSTLFLPAPSRGLLGSTSPSGTNGSCISSPLSSLTSTGRTQMFGESDVS